MEDIAPELLNKIRADFRKQFEKDIELANLAKKLEKGIATHVEAYTYAGRVGSILANVYKKNLSSNALPDGKMWYNIANRVITPTMKDNYDFISKYVNDVQENLNKAAGIGIKVIKPLMNEDRAKGIVNRLSSEGEFDKVAWILDEPIKTAARSIVDDSIKANAEFHAKSGIRPKLVRKSLGKCCKWCNAVAGIYYYPDVPKDVFRRHENCDCIVEYDPGDGKRQNVHSKQWQDTDESDKIDVRKKVGTESDKDIRKTEYRKHVNNNGLSYAESKALTDYISSDAYVINDKIRRGIELTEAERQFCKDLDSALKKIPTYSGHLSRSLFFYSETDIELFANSLQVNKSVKFPEYISTTKGVELYNPEGQVQLFIQNSSKGHDVADWNDIENEIVFDRDSKFAVINKVKHDGKWFILLEEA